MTSFVASRALPSDVEDVYQLLAAAGAQLVDEGFGNWGTPYSRERIAADVAEGTTFVVRAVDVNGRADELVATFILRRAPVRPYQPAPWPSPDAPARYLNRLAVDPRRQGLGVGGWCLAHIAEVTAAEGALAVRCDVLAANERLCRFYERAGFVERGIRGHSGWEFVCYEMVGDGS